VACGGLIDRPPEFSAAFEAAEDRGVLNPVVHLAGSSSVTERLPLKSVRLNR
jgi:hypothetical protein